VACLVFARDASNIKRAIYPDLSADRLGHLIGARLGSSAIRFFAVGVNRLSGSGEADIADDIAAAAEDGSPKTYRVRDSLSARKA